MNFVNNESPSPQQNKEFQAWLLQELEKEKNREREKEAERETERE